MTARWITRMTAPLIGVSILLLGLGVGAAWHIHHLQKTSSQSLKENVDSMRAAQQFEESIRAIRAQLDKYLRFGNRRHLDQVHTLRDQTQYYLMDADRAATTEEEKAQIHQVEGGLKRFFEEYDAVTAEPFRNAAILAIYKLVDEILTEKILKPAHAYVEFNWDMLNKNRSEIEKSTNYLVLSLLILGICGAGGGLLAGLVLAWNYRRSMVQIHVRLRDTANQLNAIVGPITLTKGDRLRDLDDDLERLAGPIREIIERLHQSEREVTRTEQLAWVGQLAAGIAHEVRNPLTTIKILIQGAAERGKAGQLGRRDVQVLLEEITRLERLIGSFLEFARPPKMEKRRLGLQEILRQSVSFLLPQAESAGVRIVCTVPRTPIEIEADPGQIHQVMYNVLLNAVQASSAGGEVHLSVHIARPRRKQQSYVLIRIVDQGPGLPSDLGEQIFEPFVSTKEAGMGLGLSICRRIVESHGGVIHATNQPQGGAVFTVTLPVGLPITRAHGESQERGRRTGQVDGPRSLPAAIKPIGPGQTPTN